MKVAITGTNGLLGQHLVRLVLEAGHIVVAIGKGKDRTLFSGQLNYVYHDVDITDKFALSAALQTERPDTFVHSAAITQVDDCELDQTKCEMVNVQGTMHSLVAAETCCNHFIFVSTDFVFDGGVGNYAEEDPAKPISFYGQTKLDAELLVKESEIPWAIVRTCLVYGNSLSGTRSNIISWVKESLEGGKPIKVVSDQVRTPTYVEDLAKGILLIIEKKARGTYHISGKDVLTPYDMAMRVASFFGLDNQLIEKVDANVFTQAAKRPPITGFNIEKARKELDYEPITFEEGLVKMFNPNGSERDTAVK